MEEKKNEKPAEEKKVEAKVNEPNKEVKAGTKKEEPKKETNPKAKKDEPKKAMEPEKKKQIIKISVIAVIILAIIIAIIVYFAVFHKKTINLADYVDVKFYTETANSYYYDETENEAYNGYATAEVSLDVDKLKDLLDSKRAC